MIANKYCLNQGTTEAVMLGQNIINKSSMMSCYSDLYFSSLNRAKWGITDHLRHNVLVCTDYLCKKVNILDYCNNGSTYQ